MIPVSVLSLIMSQAPTPSILILQPIEDMGTEKNSRVIPIWVGVSEAASLGIALEGARFKRPMTHDLFLDVLTGLDALVDHVTIYDAQGPTFYAELALRARGKILSFDARPSDAIALALRQEAPLYVTDEVMERASFPYLFNQLDEGIPYDLDGSVINPDGVMADFHNFIEQLSPEDLSSGSPSGTSENTAGEAPAAP